MKEITSQVLGQLKLDKGSDDLWISKPITVPFFNNKKLKVNFNYFHPDKDIKFIEEADTALRTFLEKNDTDKLALSSLVYDICKKTIADLDEDEVDDPKIFKIKNDIEVWKFVTPDEIYVERRDRRDKDIYISIMCECGWEPEHGLQLVFRQGKKLTRIADQDGHLTEADAYDVADSKDELLSKF